LRLLSNDIEVRPVSSADALRSIWKKKDTGGTKHFLAEMGGLLALAGFGMTHGSLTQSHELAPTAAATLVEAVATAPQSKRMNARSYGLTD
jgi:hypothetical protein